MSRALYPRLKIFHSNGFGCRTIELHGDRPLVIGRLADCDIVVTGEGVARQHCQVTPLGGGRYSLLDLDSNAGVRLNDASIHEHPLAHGDRFQVGPATLVVFVDEKDAREADLEAAIAAHPDRDEPWLVYADWLLEHDDPVGERIERAAHRQLITHGDALEGLWAAWSRGEIDGEWRHGHLWRAAVRAPLATPGWKLVVAQLLSLRVSRFLQTLVVDVGALEEYQAGAHPPLVGRWVESLLEAPLPTTLRRLSLGYLGPGEQNWPPVEPPSNALLARHPHLSPPEFDFVTGAKLIPLSLKPGTTLKGATLTQPFALSRASVHLTERQGALRLEVAPSRTDDEALRIDYVRQRWVLQPSAGTARLARVNGAGLQVSRPLLPGDLIEHDAGITLRFEL